ncbi:unnamed protein product [Cuscuta epithymum]|uniref:Uncharacterized protein n=1 Tax=Cuscuta epithymum TaxID=186058 RepID=A0AAV0CJX8_9ASTE|nr:unnamed protein product [Cuscuta epithymum]CAH9131865.1 unnamed protein product [Cuscuta epithymum]
MATFRLMTILRCALFLALLFCSGIHVSQQRPLNDPHFLQPTTVTSSTNPSHDVLPKLNNVRHAPPPSGDDVSSAAAASLDGDNPGHSPGVGHGVQSDTRVGPHA